MYVKTLGRYGIATALLSAITLQQYSGAFASSIESDHSESHAPTTPAKVLASFASPIITGFLNPSGFDRPTWEKVVSDDQEPTQIDSSERLIVVLDPGHGGIDPGTKAHNGLLEKNLTLDIARRVQLFLSEFDDIEVRLTRNLDQGLSRQDRVKGIRESQADMFISLHFNHLPQTDVTLVESFYAGRENIARSRSVLKAQNAISRGFSRKSANPASPDMSFIKGSAVLSRTIQERVFNEVSYENPKASDAGVKRDTLFVLTRSFTPGTLIELTCLSNVTEAEKLATDDYRNRLAAALADGIRSYQDTLKKPPTLKAAQLDL